MVASILDLLQVDHWGYLIASPGFLLVSLFNLWMVIHAIRNRDWIWVFFLLFGWAIASFWYYFYVYRASPTSMRGFELPGAVDRRRIKELQAKIHHLDKAHHHFQLGDIYFQQGKLEKARACYLASLERDPEDIDTRAHLGQCLLREKKPAEARPLLEGVVAQNPKHDYGHSLMALAETYAALGEIDAALNIWKQVTENHSYPRAKVQLAEIHLAKNQPDLARAEVQEVLHDDVHAPAFQRRRDRVWIRRARALSRKIG